MISQITGTIKTVASPCRRVVDFTTNRLLATRRDDGSHFLKDLLKQPIDETLHKLYDFLSHSWCDKMFKEDSSMLNTCYTFMMCLAWTSSLQQVFSSDKEPDLNLYLPPWSTKTK